MSRLFLINRYRGLAAGCHDFPAIRVRKARGGAVKSYQVSDPVSGNTVNIPARLVKAELV